MSASAELVHPLMSASSLRTNAFKLSKAFGPAAIGFYVGMTMFGDRAEFGNLLSHSVSYASQMRQIQRELYD